MASRDRRRSRRHLIVRVIAALMAAGCAGAPTAAAPPPSTAPRPPSGEPRLPPAPDPATAADRELAARVEHRLATDPTLRDAVIEAVARGGQITLTGTVPTFRERAHAIEATLSVPGVKSVRLRLVLQSP